MVQTFSAPRAMCKCYDMHFRMEFLKEVSFPPFVSIV